MAHTLAHSRMIISVSHFSWVTYFSVILNLEQKFPFPKSFSLFNTSHIFLFIHFVWWAMQRKRVRNRERVSERGVKGGIIIINSSSRYLYVRDYQTTPPPVSQSPTHSFILHLVRVPTITRLNVELVRIKYVAWDDIKI